MPLKIVKDPSDPKKRIVKLVDIKPAAIGVLYQPQSLMAREVYPEMQRIQDAFLSSPAKRRKVISSKRA